MKPVEAPATVEDQETRYCDSHQTKWVPVAGSGASCPWCTRDLLVREVENIQNAFKLAILAHENRGITGAGRLSYSGDFVSVAPCVTAQMKRWVRRWEEILGRDRSKK